MEEKICESCGMPMSKKDDFGGGLKDNSYCVYCTDDEGTLLPYEIIVENFAQFTADEQGCSIEEARELVSQSIADLPAWKNRGGGCGCCG